MSNDRKQGDYKLVPAAYFHNNHGGCMAYVRYTTKNPHNKITVVEQGPKHAYIKCPDRDLLLILNGHCEVSTRFNDGSWDEVHNFSLMHDLNNESHSIDMTMVNYTQHVGTDNGHYSRNNTSPLKRGSVITDSGGFQIAQGSYDYLCPYSYTEWANENADIAIAMDIPIRQSTKDLVLKSAAVQAKNTEIMMQNKRDGLEVMNIFHGQTFQEQQEYRKLCERDDVNLLAIGATYFDTKASAVYKILQMMMTGKTYDQYHLLGVAKIGMIYPLMYAAKKGLAPLITSDASTWLMEAVSKGYYTHRHIAEPPGFLKLFDKVNTPSAYTELPCSCKVCSVLKYTDVLSVLRGNISLFMIAHHNIFKYQSVTTGMFDIMKEASDKDIKQLVRGQLKTRSGVEETMQIFSMIDDIAKHGLKGILNKYSMYLGHLDSDSKFEGAKAGLFEAVKVKPTTKIPEDAELDGANLTELDYDPDEDEAEYRTRIEGILDTYLEEHGEVESKLLHGNTETRDKKEKADKASGKKSGSGTANALKASSSFVKRGKASKKKKKKKEVKKDASIGSSKIPEKSSKGSGKTGSGNKDGNSKVDIKGEKERPIKKPLPKKTVNGKQKKVK